MKKEKRKEFKQSDTDGKSLKSKQVRYLHDQTIHPIGYVVNYFTQMPSKTICNYTKEDSAVQKIKNGEPDAILARLTRHNPPSMPIEEIDNRISKYSAQKGKCAIF